MTGVMPFKLEKHERDTELWKKIEAHLEGRLQLRRAQNDTSKSAEETEKLRGRIAEIKELLAIGRDSAVDREAD